MQYLDVMIRRGRADKLAGHETRFITDSRNGGYFAGAREAQCGRQATAAAAADEGNERVRLTAIFRCFKATSGKRRFFADLPSTS